jgi:hypothetical protein
VSVEMTVLTTVFVVFFSSTKQALGYYYKIGHGNILSKLFIHHYLVTVIIIVIKQKENCFKLRLLLYSYVVLSSADSNHIHFCGCLLPENAFYLLMYTKCINIR